MESEFLCPLSANKHQIEFLEFTISDYATKNIIFMVSLRGNLFWKRSFIMQYGSQQDGCPPFNIGWGSRLNFSST